MIPGQQMGAPGMYQPPYPQYQNPMMMGGKGAKGAMKYQQTTLKMVLNKVCGLNFLDDKDYKKMPMGAMMPGMMPGQMPGMMGVGLQPGSLMYMDKKTKKEAFKRGAHMFFSMYPQTMMMQYQQLEQFVTANKPQVNQLFQPLGTNAMMPGMMPGMPYQQPMGMPMMPGQPMPGQPCPYPGQPMPMPGQPMPMPGSYSSSIQSPGYGSPSPGSSGSTPFYPPN